MGRGSPTVVFDSGWGDWAPVWMIVQPEVAEWTRACSYDRAGAGFSDPGPMPRTSVRIAAELRSALHNAGIQGPYILVGNAFGGDNVRTFAARYPAEVAALVLVRTKVAMYDGYISEMEQVPVDEAYLQQHRRSLGSRPIRVLSTGKHGVHSLDPARPLDPEQQKYQQEVAREQASWLELSSNAKQLFSDKSSEYIPFDQPSFVVDAIREVYTQSK
jgi:pimeloyl-ACP methyl ester carboxylesterase